MVRLLVLFTSGLVWLFHAIVKCFSEYCVNITKLIFLCRQIFGKHTVFLLAKHCQWKYLTTVAASEIYCVSKCSKGTYSVPPLNFVVL
jgi:hypothetical protein